MIRIAICDDDPSCVTTIRRAVQNWAEKSDLSVSISVFQNADDLLLHFQTSACDIIMLDVIMPLLNGMETAYEIRKEDPSVKILFLTSSPEFAVESYEVRASGYLLKPIQTDKLERVLMECVRSLALEPTSIVVRTLFGFQKISLQSIECVEAQNKKVVFYLQHGRHLEVQDALSNCAAALTLENGFFKCHRSYIVSIPNTDHFSSTEVLTRSGLAVPIARGYAKAFRDAYFDYMFQEGVHSR